MDSRPRILLIDNDLQWLQTLDDCLSRHGYEVESTERSDRGLRLLEERAAALALIDYHMPGMDGMELLDRLRQRGIEVSILMMSGDDDPRTASRALARGARAFLSKTTSLGLLLRTVRQLVDIAAQSAAVRRRYLPVLRRNMPLVRLPPQPPPSDRS